MKRRSWTHPDYLTIRYNTIMPFLDSYRDVTFETTINKKDIVSVTELDGIKGFSKKCCSISMNYGKTYTIDMSYDDVMKIIGIEDKDRV